MLLDQEEQRPRPIVTMRNARYWRGLKAHSLELPQCASCGEWVWPISPVCPHCWSQEMMWKKLSGRGRVNTWTIYHQAFHPAFFRSIPYNVVEVELDEGPRLISNLIDLDGRKIEHGMPVEIAFEAVDSELTLALFRPADAVK